MRRLHPDPVADVDVAVAYAHPDGVVRANMVSSADGAATFDTKSGALSSPADRELFLTLRKLCDVILVGASTVRLEGYGPARGEHPVSIAVVTGSLDLDPTSRFFTQAVARPIVITTEDADRDRVQTMSKVADVIAIGTVRVDIGRAIDQLAERGLTRVLTEGGPAMLADLIAGDRLDELCLTVAPVLALGHSKRITDGPPLPEPVHLELMHVLTDDAGTLFSRYRVARG